jgi:hypothetical protein
VDTTKALALERALINAWAYIDSSIIESCFELVLGTVHPNPTHLLTQTLQAKTLHIIHGLLFAEDG